MKYRGILKNRKPWMRITLLILAIYMLYFEIKENLWGYIPLNLFVILACFFEKEQIIDEKGVDIKYLLFSKYIKHHYWSWNEITTLHTDSKKAAPNIMLHIGKDIVTRTFVMNPSDCSKSIELARKMNPSIYIVNPTAAEQEQYEKEILNRKKVRKAQKKIYKRNK